MDTRNHVQLSPLRKCCQRIGIRIPPKWGQSPDASHMLAFSAAGRALEKPRPAASPTATDPGQLSKEAGTEPKALSGPSQHPPGPAAGQRAGPHTQGACPPAPGRAQRRDAGEGHVQARPVRTAGRPAGLLLFQVPAPKPRGPQTLPRIQARSLDGKGSALTSCKWLPPCSWVSCDPSLEPLCGPGKATSYL